MWKVYCYTTPSNKKYIGITKNSLKQRLKSGYNAYFSNAIDKYGYENIKVEILEDNLTLEEASQKERYYIHLYETTNKDKGYNITTGGEGKSFYDYDEIVNYYEKVNYNFKETLKNFHCTSKTLLDILELYNFDRKEIIRQIARQRYIEQEKNVAVIQYDLLGNYIQDYITLRDAAKAVGLSQVHGIVDVCNNKRNKAGGFYWRFRKDYDVIPKKIEIKTFSSKHWGVKVGQYSKDGKLINVFDSIKEANLFLGKSANNSNITSVCKGRRKSAYGYFWKYEEESD